MSLGSVFVLLVVAGLVLATVSILGLRGSGASPGVARRLAGAREVKVGRLLGDEPLPERAVRVSGRLRCRDPLDVGGGERLVAFHRDVEVRIGGTWRSIERLRETRSFELWDHDGSLTLDPAEAAEPLVVIPKVWRGDATQLEEPHASAAKRLVERTGPATEARAITRTLNVTDRLLVLAKVTRAEDGRPRLTPPAGGFVVTNLAIDDAMRLLGGRHRRRVAAGVAGIGIAIALLAVGGIGALATALLAR